MEDKDRILSKIEEIVEEIRDYSYAIACEANRLVFGHYFQIFLKSARGMGLAEYVESEYNLTDNEKEKLKKLKDEYNEWRVFVFERYKASIPDF